MTINQSLISPIVIVAHAVLIGPTPPNLAVLVFLVANVFILVLVLVLLTNRPTTGNPPSPRSLF